MHCTGSRSALRSAVDRGRALCVLSWPLRSLCGGCMYMYMYSAFVLTSVLWHCAAAAPRTVAVFPHVSMYNVNHGTMVAWPRMQLQCPTPSSPKTA